MSAETKSLRTFFIFSSSAEISEFGITYSL